jgi:XTP/dITP diphosphohydrolase
MRIVVATGNAHKLAELQSLFGPLGHRLVAQRELGIGDAEEPHYTFLENALAKARHASLASGLPALADDSGLCVGSLGGAPGVHSARFARIGGAEPRLGRGDAANNALLLEKLSDFDDAERRSAHFFCALVALRSADDPEPLVAFGRLDGVVLPAARGLGGFGYDPLLYLPTQGCTVAELSPEAKNRLSHRAQAARRLAEQMRRHWPASEHG